MNIGIDASRAINEGAGVGKYTANLIQSLQKIDKVNKYYLLFNFWREAGLKSGQAHHLFSGTNTTIIIRKFPGPVKEKLLKTRIGFYRYLLPEFDVYLAPTFLDFDVSLKIPSVLVIYDLAMFYYPDYYERNLGIRFQNYTAIACKKAGRIVAISENTKNDLVKFLKINPNKISVIYPGLNEFPEMAKQLPGEVKSKSYCLSVGTVEPRKNLINLLKAYDLLPAKTQKEFPLLIVGAKGWRDSDIWDTYKGIGAKENIHFLGYLNDQQLAKLYSDAGVFIYPSLYEGFGLPIIEAMSFGTPVITSNTSSMPEAAGGAARLIDPDNPQMIAGAIADILSDSGQAEKMREEGITQAEKFNWDIVAQGFLNELKDAYENRG